MIDIPEHTIYWTEDSKAHAAAKSCSVLSISQKLFMIPEVCTASLIRKFLQICILNTTHAKVFTNPGLGFSVDVLQEWIL